MASSLKVNRIVPSTGTNIGFGTANGQIRLASTSKLTWDGDTNTYINHPSADTIAAFTAGGERLRITDTGRIDILGDGGNAGFTLSNAYGQAGFFGGMYYSGSSWTRNAIGTRKGAGMYVNTGGHVAFLKSTETSGTSATVTESVRITDTGNVGINTTDVPKALVIAKDSAAAIIELKRTNTNTTGSFGALSWTAMDGHSVANMYAIGDGDNEGANLVFRTTSAAASNDPYNAATVERLRITSAGDVGISHGQPSAGLHIKRQGRNFSLNEFYDGYASDNGIHNSSDASSIVGSQVGERTHSLILESTTTAAADRGSSIGFRAKSGDTLIDVTYAAIVGAKENSVTDNSNGYDDQAKGYLAFYTSNEYAYSPHYGTRNIERLRIKSDGDIEAGGNLKTNNLPGNNLIHNGEFAIWQRGTTAIYSSQNKYLADRFKFISSTDGNGSVHQHANVPTVAQTGGSQFAYSLRLNCTTADASLASTQYINLSQRIEGRNLRHLGFGQSGVRYATLSFWQRSPNGTYHVSFRNSSYNRYYIASYTAANNTWEKHELTIPVDTTGTWATNNDTGLDITWSLGGGSGYTSGTVGSWQPGSNHAGSGQKNFFDTVGNDFYITGVQFEKGSVATPFEHKSYGEDLLQCQRYFFTITPPNGFIGSTEDLGAAFASSANEVQFPIKFPVEMRGTPTVEQVTGSNYFRIAQGNLGGDKYISGNWIVNNMSPNCGNLYTDPDSNLSSYIGQMGTIQLKNTAARLYLRSEL